MPLALRPVWYILGTNRSPIKICHSPIVNINSCSETGIWVPRHWIARPGKWSREPVGRRQDNKGANRWRAKYCRGKTFIPKHRIQPRVGVSTTRVSSDRTEDRTNHLYISSWRLWKPGGCRSRNSESLLWIRNIEQNLVPLLLFWNYSTLLVFHVHLDATNFRDWNKSENLGNWK